MLIKLVFFASLNFQYVIKDSTIKMDFICRVFFVKKKNKKKHLYCLADAYSPQRYQTITQGVITVYAVYLLL